MKLPQLSLRDLFWLVLVCALGLALWVERGRPKREAAMWEKNARYWRGNAEALATDILAIDPTWSTTFDGIPPTPAGYELSKTYSADVAPAP
jgi:hypothetical protein